MFHCLQHDLFFCLLSFEWILRIACRIPLLQAFSLSEITNVIRFRVFAHSPDTWNVTQRKFVKDTYAQDLDGRHTARSTRTFFMAPFEDQWTVCADMFKLIASLIQFYFWFYFSFGLWCLLLFFLSPFFFSRSRFGQIYLGSWSAGRILCEIWISLDILLCTASILSLCAISLDR